MRFSNLIIYITATLATAAIMVGSASAQEATIVESALTSTKDDYSLAGVTAQHQLKPPDTSSPRSTLQSFIDNVNRSYRVLMAAHRKNMKTPGFFTPKAVEEVADNAKGLFERAIWCLNLSQVPVARKENVSYEATLKLKEILDRIELPHFNQIPDAEAVARELEEKKYPRFLRWIIPNTSIEIARVEDGPRKGEFLFTPETIDRLDEYYGKVQNLPYKLNAFITRDFLKFYVSTPGRLLPPKWSQWLPSWANAIFHNQTVWQWVAMVVLLLIVIMVNWLLSLRWKRRTVGLSPMTRSWGWTVILLVATATFAFSLYLLDEQINISGSVLKVLEVALQTISLFLLATASLVAATAVAETIIASPKIDPEGINASLIKALIGLIGIFAGAIILFYGLSRLGISLIPLLTGLGVGGLAVALAARPTLENIIGGFMILADRPYRVGQRVKVQGYYGDVEKIGLRSTRIRLRDGHQTIIPNETMARVDVENVGRRPYIRRASNIRIKYGTPVQKAEKAIKIIEDILDNHEGMDPEYPPWVCFNEFNPDSLNIMMWYWYHPPDILAAYAFHQKVNLEIMRAFEKEGIDFAFPTTTNYLTQEDEKPLQIKITGE